MLRFIENLCAADHSRWRAKHIDKEEGILPMNHARYRASSVLNKNGDMWVLGGTSGNLSSDSTEVYEYKAGGKGTWRKGHPLPPDYRDSGIESHCTVR